MVLYQRAPWVEYSASGVIRGKWPGTGILRSNVAGISSESASAAIAASQTPSRESVRLPPLPPLSAQPASEARTIIIVKQLKLFLI